jgi:hypothetical protein
MGPLRPYHILDLASPRRHPCWGLNTLWLFGEVRPYRILTNPLEGERPDVAAVPNHPSVHDPFVS